MDKFFIEISKIQKEIYCLDNVKKLIGKLLKELKKDIVPLCDRSILSLLLCKGNTTKCINPHQACHAASVYAVQYHLKEGYELESAKQLGCMMWNRINNCKYFVKWIDKIKINRDDYDKNILLLEKMCRLHHKRCNYAAIEHMIYETAYKMRPYTFWMCFDDAIKSISMKNKKDLTQLKINNALRKWNLDNKCDFFQFIKKN